MFSCEFCEISKNTFPYKAPLVAASANVFTYFTTKFRIYSST